MKGKILNQLLDKYERSLTFKNENTKKQSFSLEISKVFPKYSDDFDLFQKLNSEIEDLCKKNFISLKKEKNQDLVKSVSLNLEKIDEIYTFLNRVPRKNEQENLLKILCKFENPEKKDSILYSFIQNQKERIVKNQNVEFFDNENKDFDSFKDILLAIQKIEENETEIFIRDFSISIFGDSKRLEKIKSSIESILKNYGEIESDDILAEFNILKTPTYVFVKGNALIHFKSQILNLSELSGDIGLSTQTLKEIEKIEVLGERVITIENLTTFHDFEQNEDFIIYLAGFHNSVKRDFLKKIFETNNQKKYFHFGDIDAGGFYIFEHLKNKTSIPFEKMNMDIETLKKFKEKTKSLTKEDVKRLSKLSENAEYKEICEYMIKNNCKLEQEAFGLLPSAKENFI